MKKLNYKLHGLDMYEDDDGKEYAVGTQEQAQDAAEAIARDMLWACEADFVVDFIVKHNDDMRAMSEQGLVIVSGAIRAAQENIGEDADKIILLLLGKHVEEFVKLVVTTDGRGSEIASYDGREIDSGTVEGLPPGLLAFRIS